MTLMSHMRSGFLGLKGLEMEGLLEVEMLEARLIRLRTAGRSSSSNILRWKGIQLWGDVKAPISLKSPKH